MQIHMKWLTIRWVVRSQLLIHNRCTAMYNPNVINITVEITRIVCFIYVSMIIIVKQMSCVFVACFLHCHQMRCETHKIQTREIRLFCSFCFFLFCWFEIELVSVFLVFVLVFSWNLYLPLNGYTIVSLEFSSKIHLLIVRS